LFFFESRQTKTLVNERKTCFFFALSSLISTFAPQSVKNMSQHNEYGRSGEDVAAEYLADKGYLILERNWHMGHKELDIIAQKNEQLIIVEVKTRQRDKYGRPEEAVTMQKIKKIVVATKAYVRFRRIDMPIRFDVIAITGLGTEKAPKIVHFEDAFSAPMFSY
jgi:putative endonuclease